MPIPLPLLSPITYRMKNEVFRGGDLRVGLCRCIIAVTLFVQNVRRRREWWGMNGGTFDAIVIGIFYFIFILVSPY